MKTFLQISDVRRKWIASGLCLAVALSVGVFAPAAIAAELPKEVSHETREFKVLIEGKERGSAKMRISTREEGTEVMEGKASVELDFIVYKYAYASTGWEIWKDGKLVKLRNVSNYNGDKYSVRGEVKGDDLVVSVNDQEQKLPADTWVTTYWKLPVTDEKNHALTLFDSDQGKQNKGEVSYVGKEELKVEEKLVEAKHYRISGDLKVDLWYDNSNRLVRQESVELKQKTVVELERIVR